MKIQDQRLINKIVMRTKKNWKQCCGKLIIVKGLGLTDYPPFIGDGYCKYCEKIYPNYYFNHNCVPYFNKLM